MYKKILMPVDVFEMDLSDKAVRHAANLAKAEGASITLVNILPTSSRSLLRGFNADIKKFEEYMTEESGNDSNLLIVFYVQIMPDDLVMQLQR
ncbi:universal stress protein, partial [Enterobacter roggenkampii]